MKVESIQMRNVYSSLQHFFRPLLHVKERNTACTSGQFYTIYPLLRADMCIKFIIGHNSVYVYNYFLNFTKPQTKSMKGILELANSI